MAAVLPGSGAAVILTDYLKAGNLAVRLFSNNVTPANDSTAASFTQVAGGGYSPIILTPDAWDITAGDPSEADAATITFTFTSATTAPGTVYGYYVVNEEGALMWAELLPEAVLPLTPVKGSKIAINPLAQCV